MHKMFCRASVAALGLLGGSLSAGVEPALCLAPPNAGGDVSSSERGPSIGPVGGAAAAGSAPISRSSALLEEHPDARLRLVQVVFRCVWG